ncbi:MAG: ATPase, T2SS/T4P/T4SS family [Sulfurimonas sp.]|uniref:ATPase, T2SS/T4P/T4SS family n=1 Tax=Sulfurimonas sp. TaxID=2022749 RepID=UPI002617F4C4|nr:ATPase, T2SS/T4P/T4SS family [Sulfurimonas sp.]MDD5373332.1 ATPase, T2SS/T4P/T4SS family [Sulfurimonas sp.]
MTDLSIIGGFLKSKSKSKKQNFLSLRFDKKNAHVVEKSFERIGESLLRKYYVEHLKTQPEYSTKSEEKILEEIEGEKIDIQFFIGNDKLHGRYIEELNKVLYQDSPKRYITSFGELDSLYSLEEWQKFHYVNDIFAKGEQAELDEDLLKNSKKIRLLFEQSTKNLIIPIENKKTNRRAIGLMAPVLAANKFFYDEMVFISPEIVSSIFTTKNFDIFESSLVNKSPREYAETLLTAMIVQGYSDLDYYVNNEYFYAIGAEKDGVRTILTEGMPIKTAELITEAFLGMMKKRKSTDAIVKRKISFRHKHKQYHFRINMIRQSKTKQIGVRRNRTVAIRLLADISKLRGYESSNIYPEVVEIIKTGCRSGGMFFWVGETGSGKSTSLYRDLYSLWTEDGAKRLITIDNPMEYEIDGAIQFDLSDSSDSDSPMTIEKITAEVLQQNPDYCSLGEVKTKSEFKSFVELGIRGHTTGGTLHSDSTKSAIKLISETGEVPLSTLAPSISFIAHQTLVERVCQHCRTTGESRLFRAYGGEGGGSLGDKRDCSFCKGSKNYGVVPVIELAYFGKLGENDNIYDYEGLVKDKKMIYISKLKYASMLLEDGEITPKTFNKLQTEFGERLEDKLSDRAIAFAYGDDALVEIRAKRVEAEERRAALFLKEAVAGA